MNPQFLVDGLLSGAMIGLGAIGVTLTYSILRFANFAHGEFIAWGAYAALGVASALGWLFAGLAPAIGPFSFGWSVILALLVAMPLTGFLALALDWALFARLRGKAGSITVVMASFGASMTLRSLLEFSFTSRPAYFSRDLQIAVPFGGVRATPDQMALTLMAGALVAALHLLLTRTQTGRAMRAVSENPALARVAGIDVDRVVKVTWFLGAALAAASGIMAGSSCRSGLSWVLTCCCRCSRRRFWAASAAFRAPWPAGSSSGSRKRGRRPRSARNGAPPPPSSC